MDGWIDIYIVAVLLYGTTYRISRVGDTKWPTRLSECVRGGWRCGGGDHNAWADEILEE